MFVPCASANHGETKQTSSANWQTETEIDTKAVSTFCTVSSRDGLTSRCCYIVAFPSFPCKWVGIILRWQRFLVFVVVSTDSVYTYNVTYSYSTYTYLCLRLHTWSANGATKPKLMEGNPHSSIPQLQKSASASDEGRWGCAYSEVKLQDMVPLIHSHLYRLDPFVPLPDPSKSVDELGSHHQARTWGQWHAQKDKRHQKEAFQISLGALRRHLL